MIVTCCHECPFFHETGAHLLFALVGRVPSYGTCNYDAANDSVVRVELGMPAGPEHDAMLLRARSRLVVLDRRAIPDGCPLRTRNVTITLGS